MKRWLPAFSLLLMVYNAYSQRAPSEDVLYLKNQWVIRGMILVKTDSLVKIQSLNGNVYVFTLAEIDRMEKQKPWHPFVYKKTGFAHFTELGPLVAGKTSIEGVTTAAFSFQTISGYKFSQAAFMGLGLGADLYATQTIIPVFGSFRGDISAKGSVIPYYFADLGYGINITQRSAAGDNYQGGLLWAAGLGLKIPFNRSAGFLLSAGYRYQQTQYTQAGVRTQVTYNRLAIRAGFFL